MSIPDDIPVILIGIPSPPINIHHYIIYRTKAYICLYSPKLFLIDILTEQSQEGILSNKYDEMGGYKKCYIS